mgnify:FL=1|jgi:hypothetical protein
MATRSTIAIKTEDGIKAIYCHWDGYVDHNGRILKDNYVDAEQVNALIDLGDLSSLSTEIGEKHDFDDRSTHKDEWCTYYGRDRGEDAPATIYPTIAEWVEGYAESWCEYFYLFDGQDWIVSNGKKDADGNFEFDFLEVAILKEIVSE